MFCIVGADGFLGAEFINCLLEKSNEKILALNHENGVFPDGDRIENLPFEMSDDLSVGSAAEKLSSCRDIKIFHLACVHNPDVVKKDPVRAGYINTVCYEKFLDRLKGLDITRFIYASSDTVYGENGSFRPFRESDPLNPVNAYGRQKAEAEKITFTRGYSAVRLPYMSGASKTPKKKHFFDTLVEKLLAGQQIDMLTDYVRSCLSYAGAAELIRCVFDSGFSGTAVNVCADEPTDKYTIGLMAADYCGAPRSLVHAVTSDELGIFDEYRANVLTMDNSLLKNITGITGKIDFSYK